MFAPIFNRFVMPLKVPDEITEENLVECQSQLDHLISFVFISAVTAKAQVDGGSSWYGMEIDHLAVGLSETPGNFRNFNV